MFARLIVIFTVAAGMAGGLNAEERTSKVNVGDLVAVRMTGDLAKAYARSTGALKEEVLPDRLEIEIMARISQKLDDGRYRIEHSSQIAPDDKPRLVTFAAIVDPMKITSHVVPKGTPLYRSPTDPAPMRTIEDHKVLQVHLTELKDLKLQTWDLAKEIGE